MKLSAGHYPASTVTTEFGFNLAALRPTHKGLEERVERMQRRRGTLQLEAHVRSVQFLRGVGSRASLILPAFYFHRACQQDSQNGMLVEGYPGIVLHSYLGEANQILLGVVTRKIFDHGKRWTGADFARHSKETIERHADYWATRSKRPIEECRNALVFLQTVFADCSRDPTRAMQIGSPLAKRVALLKLYGDRSAAHLSIDDYCFGFEDVVHVVAALVVIGEIVRSFDRPSDPENYFNDVDEAAFESCNRLFPSAMSHRLFEHASVPDLARSCVRVRTDRGFQWLTEQLPMALGWYLEP